MRLLLALALVAGLAQAQGANNQGRPFIGYLCAAGGQRGTVVHVVAGGQNLRGARAVVLTGEGVDGKVLEHGRTPWLMKPEVRRLVAQRLRRLAVQAATGRKGKRTEEQPEEWPDHPMLKDLDQLGPKDLRRLAYEFLDPARRSQLSPQIAEVVELEIRIDEDAAPGERELRIRTPRGLTNPVVFHVGLLPEFNEREPNDYLSSKPPIVDLPCVWNGQVSFKDLDRFRFRARRGQRLVFDVQARRLVPYLADAVPGWFQATLALYDVQGNEIGFADDHLFDPDPVMFFEAPADGVYILEIRDAIYRGREDFVYRVTISERPYITSMFPLGGRAESFTPVEIDGWNLRWETVALDTWTDAGRIQHSSWGRGANRTNSLRYAVDDLPERLEGGERAAWKDLPLIVNGRISSPGEVDLFRFEGRAGKQVAVEVHARRLDSPLDSLIQLTDESGRALAWNDDFEDKTAGLVTHQADSYLRYTLPSSGTYGIRLIDAQGNGGKPYAYRLRVGPPRPGFTVMVVPASINVPAGGTAPFTVHAVRRDGFDGEIELQLANAPAGFFLSGARIPAGCDHIRMTIGAPPKGSGAGTPIGIEAHARIDGRPVTRFAVPAEDMMQAFGLRHLVAAEELWVDVVRSGRRIAPPRLKDERPVRVRAGSKARVGIDVSGTPALDKLEFRLSDPPKGISLVGVEAASGGVELLLTAERGKVASGFAGNLIVEVYYLYEPGGGKDKGKGKQKAKTKSKQPAEIRRAYLGVLPAIPIVVG